MSTLLVLLLAFVVGSFAHAAPRSKPVVVHFDIPGGDAITTLDSFVRQSFFPALFAPEQVRGVQTNAVSGDMEAREALKKMLEGTELVIWEGDNGAWLTITRADSKVPPVASKPLDMRQQGAVATVPTDSSRARPVAAYTQKYDGPKLEEVVITGTLIHGVVDVMSPLETVTRRQMNQSSYSGVQDVIRQLPMNFNGGVTEATPVVGNFALGTAVNLRGLGAGATLVLVNGRRLPYSGTENDFVDVSNLPRNVVDRIEVLPDGASALYGSDAIAGVVNIILEKNFSGGETTARIGTSPAGANEKVFSQLAGTSWDTGNALVSYQYTERTALAAAQRDYMRDTDKTSLGGTDHRTYLSSPGNLLDPATLLPVAGIQPGENGKAPTLSDTINLQNQYAAYEPLPDRRAHSMFLSASQRLGDRVNLFSDILLGKRDTTQQLYGAPSVLYVPSSNPFLSTAIPNASFALVGYNFTGDLGPMRVRTSSRTASVTVGAKFELSEQWRATLSESYGRERLRYGIQNEPDLDAVALALEDSDPATALNPFGNSFHLSRAALDSIRLVDRGSATSEIKTTSAVADGPIVTLPSGQAKLAIGAEHRQETLHREITSNANFARAINSAFAELSVPLVGEGGNRYAVPRLELSLAGRFESYSDFGTTTNPKVGLRWTPLASLKFRTSWGTSFRAPRLVDLYNSAQNAAGLRNVPDPLSPKGTSVVLLTLGNNPNLKQETASTWTAGIDFVPSYAPGFTASLTYYAIDYDNQVSTPLPTEQNTILIEEAQQASRIKRNPSSAEVNAICNSSIFKGAPNQCSLSSIAAIVDFGPQNVARTREQGIDLKIDQSLDTRYGKFSFGLFGTYMLDFEQAGSRTSSLVDVADTVSKPLSKRLRGTFEWYQHAWDLPGFGVSFALDHSGGYGDVQADRPVGSWTTADMRLSYRTARDGGSLNAVELGLNASNLFNRSPPFVDNEIGFDAANAQPYGRVISLTVQKRW